MHRGKEGKTIRLLPHFLSVRTVWRAVETVNMAIVISNMVVAKSNMVDPKSNIVFQKSLRVHQISRRFPVNWDMDIEKSVLAATNWDWFVQKRGNNLRNGIGIF